MAKETHSRSRSAMGGHKSSSKGGKKPHSIHIKRGKSGGFIVTHHHKPEAAGGMTPEPEDHVVPDMDALQDHVQDTMGDQGAAGEQEPAPAPAAGAAPPAVQGM